MSTTGRRTVGWQDPRLLPLLLARNEGTLEGYLAANARVTRIIGSPGYREPADVVEARGRETYARGLSASGVARQTLAILRQPDRSRRLRELTMPALVIHGLADKMVHVSGGRATARAIPGAELLLIPGMGHDLPADLHQTYVDAIARVAARSERVGEQSD
jgi:pimeloyl-ACP methyl ester carboxylesterase